MTDREAIWFYVGLMLGGIIWMIGSTVNAADLPLPRKRPVNIDTSQRIIKVPAPGMCLQTGREPYSGQILVPDKRCPSGLRWEFQK